MTLFAAHTLLSYEDIKQYLVHTLHLFQETKTLIVTEIGDGNINYVFQITETTTGKRMIVKQGDVLLRSSGRPLALSRSKIEADILKLYGQLVPDHVPQVYAYDETLALIVMEDISACKNLRHELSAEKRFPCFVDQISTFLVETLFSTTDLCWDNLAKKKLVQTFTNPEMCAISEDLVFTEPYNDYRSRNVITDGNLAFVTTTIYQDAALIQEVAALRERFMNYPQSLLHGDLHSGSIFVNDQALKVIDPEFAFYGPMGYDIGNVIAHLFFSLAKATYYSENSGFISWLSETIVALFQQVEKKLLTAYQTKVTLSLYKSESFKNHYIRAIMADTIGYTGTEIIRRVIGDAKVTEINQATQDQTRLLMERHLLTFAKKLILNRKEITTGQQLINAYHALAFQQKKGEL